MRINVAAVAIALLAVGLLPRASRSQNAPATTEQNLEAYRAEAEALSRDGSWWYASNEDYMEADGQEAAQAYGIRHWIQPGGLSRGGCLWSIRDGEPPTVAWWFYTAWDVVESRPFVYQAHASGQGTGLGFGKEVDGDATIIDQELAWLGEPGTVNTVRHRERWLDDDTRVSESFNRVDDGWVPRRTYTWERRTDGPVPCGPESATPDTSRSSAQDPHLAGFERFIGRWAFPDEFLEANPGAADHWVRTWEWGSAGAVVWLGETVHKSDPNRTVFEGFAYWHPVRDRVEFVGYNLQLHFFLEGHYERLGPDGLTRVYTVHYPSDFEHDTYPEVTGQVREYRSERRFIEPDVLESRTFMRIEGEWIPWPTPDAAPFRVVRSQVDRSGPEL